MRKINQKEHYFYIDILRILACLCVIYMQCNRIADPYTDTSVYRQRMFVETIAYWAVPVFFMISGATLYQERLCLTIERGIRPVLILRSVFLKQVYRLLRGH